MKTVVMRTGAGIAIPLPGRLAEALGLSPGSTVRVEGPDDEGAIRIVPIPSEERATALAAPQVARSTSGAAPRPPTPADVARALSGSGPVPAKSDDPVGITREIDRLMERHGDALREIEP